MIPFSQLNSLTSAFLQCSGDMVTPSLLNAFMCLLDIVFNALFIPHFGVLGAGMGTALACAVISLIMAWRCFISNKRLRLRRMDKHHFDRNILKKALNRPFSMPKANVTQVRPSTLGIPLIMSRFWYFQQSLRMNTKPP